MKFTLNWLKEHLDTTASLEDSALPTVLISRRSVDTCWP